MYNSEYFQNSNESTVTGDNNYVNQNIDMDVTMNGNPQMMGTMSSCPKERVVHRTFVHEVPHV